MKGKYICFSNIFLVNLLYTHCSLVSMDISSQSSSSNSLQGPQPSVAVIVKVSGGSTFTVQVPNSNATIADIKALAESSSKIPRSAQRLLYKGKPLNDTDTLADKGIPSSATLFLVRSSTATIPVSQDAADTHALVTSDQGSTSSPVPCAGNCGFYGSSSLGNYCSKCHKEKKERELKEAEEAKERAEAEAAEALKPKEMLDERDDQTDKTRCWQCEKKIGLTGVRCRCGYHFCAAHRYAESHDCDYDYKTNERRKLTKQNPVVQANKLSEKA